MRTFRGLQCLSPSQRGLAALGLGATFFLSPPLIARDPDIVSDDPTAISLAHVYAPLWYVDTSRDIDDTFDPPCANPIDAIVSPFFDGDEDFTNNAKHLCAYKDPRYPKQGPLFPPKAAIWVSQIETQSHTYLAYTKYQVFDTGPGSHTQDTEMVWVVVRKTASPSGELEFIATNAHGFPNIYSLESAHEKRLRERIWRALSTEERFNVTFLFPMVDHLGTKHHGDTEHRLKLYTSPSSSSPQARQGPKIFVTRKGHALYKLNPDAWRGGLVYALAQDQISPKTRSRSQIQTYELLDFDAYMLTQFPPGASPGLPPSSDLLQRRFDLTRILAPLGYTDRASPPELTPRPLPRFLASAQRFPRESPKANLFYDWTLKTPHRLWDPAQVHHFLDPDNAERISSTYLFNPYHPEGPFIRRPLTRDFGL